MTCPACEQRIERVLSKLDGVNTVNASYAKGAVTISFDPEIIALSDIKSRLGKMDYPVDDGDKTKPIMKWVWSLVILTIIILGYILLERTGILNMFPMPDENTALPVLFLIGVLTSVHCVAMCGGINISQCSGVANKKSASGLTKIMPSLLYNAGRVVSFTIIGGIVGAIGSIVAPSGSFRGIVAIVASIFMLIMGLNMLGFFPFLRKLVPHMPKFLTKKVDDEKVGKGPFVVGLLNGLMPCGPLQAMQLYALSSGSFLTGALSMFLFSLGTVPLMFSLGALSSFLTAKFNNIMMIVSAVLVILLGLMMLNNGLSLSGFQPLF